MPSPFRLLSRGDEGHRAPTPAISTIHEHERDLSNPVPLDRGCPRCELRWVDLPFWGWPAELLRFRGQVRLSPPRLPPVAIARTEVGYPDSLGSDTFCRRRVTRTAGGAASSGTACVPVTCPPCGLAFARPAALGPAFARPSGRAASRGFPRRKLRSAERTKKAAAYPVSQPSALRRTSTPPGSVLDSGRSQRLFSAFVLPKVSSVVGRSPGEGTCSANRTKPRLILGKWAVIHRLFPACGNLAGAFSTPAAWTHFDKMCPDKSSCPGLLFRPEGLRRNPGPQRPRRLLRSR
jgi:hypothetical protein